MVDQLYGGVQESPFGSEQERVYMGGGKRKGKGDIKVVRKTVHNNSAQVQVISNEKGADRRRAGKEGRKKKNRCEGKKKGKVRSVDGGGKRV